MAQIGQVLPQGRLDPPHGPARSAEVVGEVEEDIVSPVGYGEQQVIGIRSSQADDVIIWGYGDRSFTRLQLICALIVQNDLPREIRKAAEGFFRGEPENLSIHSVSQYHSDPYRQNGAFPLLIQRVGVEIMDHVILPFKFRLSAGSFLCDTRVLL